MKELRDVRRGHVRCKHPSIQYNIMHGHVLSNDFPQSPEVVPDIHTMSWEGGLFQPLYCLGHPALRQDFEFLAVRKGGFLSGFPRIIPPERVIQVEPFLERID